MNRSVLWLLIPLIAGCNARAHKVDQDSDKVSVRADGSGNISFDVPFAKGQVKVPSGFMHNGDIDIDGVKLMPGSQVVGFNLDSHNNVSNVELTFTAPAPPDQVRAYFLDQFRKQGAEAEISGDAVIGKSRDGNPFTIQVGPVGNRSQGKISVQDKG